MTAALEARGGIWRWADAFEPQVAADHRLTLGEGHTPLIEVPALTARLRIGALLLKRDDLSPGGSHKSRSLAYRISLACARGEKAAVISSSGNAATAASMYCARAAIQLIAFVSPSTSAIKLAPLMRDYTLQVRSAKPRNLARYAARVFGLPNLTPSLDDLSIEGFKSIACELNEEAPLDHFFTFVTSGSSFLGVARMARRFGWRTALHAVQAGAAGQLAGSLDARFMARALPPSELAGLLGIDESPRTADVQAQMRQSGGRGWVQSDDEIRLWHAYLRDCGVDTSAEGAACVAAVARARDEGVLRDDSRVAVLLTGHASQWPAAAIPQASHDETPPIDGYVEVRDLLMRRLRLQLKSRGTEA